MKPTTSPPTSACPGVRRKSRAATSPVQIGVAAVSMPASDESIHCSATEYIVSGRASPEDTEQRDAHPVFRAMRTRRVAGTSQRAIAPNATRPNVTSPGSK